MRPPPGPYALFHHLAFAQERISDLCFIFERMVTNRRELGKLFQRELQLNPLDSPQQPRTAEQDEELRRIMRRDTYLLQALRLDFESLYVFGAIFLDQWAISAAYLANLPNPEGMTFTRIARRLESGSDLPCALRPIAASFLGDIRWLHLQLRTFRNRFVEHADRPWQRGTTADVHGMSFRLYLPSPPGWVNDEQVEAEIRALLRLAPKWLQGVADTYWEKARPRALLERLVENIGAVVSQADRDRIAKTVGKAGVTTPSFEVLAKRIAQFAIRATTLLLDSALQQPVDIQLGMPWSNKIDLLEQRVAPELTAKRPSAHSGREAARRQDARPGKR